jgi:hypothetical protein
MEPTVIFFYSQVELSLADMVKGYSPFREVLLLQVGNVTSNGEHDKSMKPSITIPLNSARRKEGSGKG